VRAARGDRRVADPGAGFQHQAGQPADRDLGTGSVGIDGDEGTVADVELGPLDEDQLRPIPEGDRLGRSQSRQAHAARRMSISPQPKALALPKPRASAARKVAGSVTVRLPRRSRMPNCGCPLRGPPWPGRATTE